MRGEFEKVTFLFNKCWSLTYPVQSDLLLTLLQRRKKKLNKFNLSISPLSDRCMGGTLFLTHLVKFGRAFFFGFLLFTVWQEDRGGLRTSSFLVTMMMLCCCLSVSKKLYVWDGHGPKTWIEFELNWQSTCLPGFYQWLDEITSSPYLEKTHYDRTGSTEKFNNICRPFPSLDKDMDSPIRTVKELSCILLFSLSSVNVIGKYVNNSSAVSFLVCFLLFFCFFFCWEGVGEKV